MRPGKCRSVSRGGGGGGLNFPNFSKLGQDEANHNIRMRMEMYLTINFYEMRDAGFQIFNKPVFRLPIS